MEGNGFLVNLQDIYKVLEYENSRKKNILNDYGFTRMGLGNHSQYFLLVPNQNNPEKAYLDGIDYPTFFKDFSDKDTFEAFIMLDKRGSRKAFTNNYLVNNMGITSEKADKILSISFCSCNSSSRKALLAFTADIGSIKYVEPVEDTS